MTVTSVLTNVINIEVKKGTELEKYKRFDVRNAHKENVCSISFSAHLDDCSDAMATSGSNVYTVEAVGPTVTSTSQSFTAVPLKKNCTLFIIFLAWTAQDLWLNAYPFNSTFDITKLRTCRSRVLFHITHCLRLVVESPNVCLYSRKMLKVLI